MAEPPHATGTIDRREVDQFEALASEWWNPAGQMKPLHRINPLRIRFIRDEAARHFSFDPRQALPFEDLRILDIGCGGGLLSEPLARLGGQVTGIDPGATNIEIARAHALRSRVAVDYRAMTAEVLAETDARFDIVLAMEVVEHVADLKAFVAAASALIAPRGLFIGSTLNRTLKSFALAIVGAEYVLRWLPRGTHTWEKFVRPEEFADALRGVRLIDAQTKGMVYAPLADDWQLSDDTSVNYFISARKR